MKTYDALKEEFEQKVERLRQQCPHKDISGWMEIHWAIGHPTGNHTKICNICKKTTHWKGTEPYCTECGTTDLINALNPCRHCGASEDKVIARYIEKNFIQGSM